MDPVQAYIAAWSEADPSRREALLRSCWEERSEIIGPGYHFRGLKQVLDEMERFRREQPGLRAVATSTVDRHGAWARFAIAMVDAQGRVLHEGWDIVELAPEGTIARVVTFWGTLQPVPGPP